MPSSNLCANSECLSDSIWTPTVSSTGFWAVKMFHRSVMACRTDFTLWIRTIFFFFILGLLAQLWKKKFNQVEFFLCDPQSQGVWSEKGEVSNQRERMVKKVGMGSRCWETASAKGKQSVRVPLTTLKTVWLQVNYLTNLKPSSPSGGISNCHLYGITKVT